MVGLDAPGDGSVEGRADRLGGAMSARGELHARGHAGVVVALVALALAVRIGACLRTAVIFNDGPIFLAIAEQMSAGRLAEAIAAFQHPGYPALVAAFRPIVGDLFHSALVVSLVFGSLSVAALYAFLVQAWDRRVAAVGGLMLAINPYAARFSGDVQSEPVYLFFFLAAVAASFAALRRGAVALALAAGALAGLAYLTRPEGIGVAAVVTLLAFVAWLRGGWSGRHMLFWVAALGAGTGIVMAPYLWAVRAASGDFRLSQKKSVLAIFGLEPTSADTNVADVAGAATPLTEDVVVFALAAAAVVLGASLLMRLRGSAAVRVRVGSIALSAALIAVALLGAVSAPDSFGVLTAAVVSTIRPEILLLIVVGVLAGVRRAPSGRTMFVTTLVGLYAVVLFGLLLTYGYLSRRHVLPPLTLLLGYAATGALVVVDALADKLRGRGVAANHAAATAMIAVLGVIMAVSLPKAWHDHRGEEMPVRLAAEWLREHAPGDGLVASNRLKHGWYAGRDWRPLRHEGRLLPLAHLYQSGVRWLILEDDLLDSVGRAEAVLREDTAVRLVERHRVVEAGRSVVVVEVLPRQG